MFEQIKEKLEKIAEKHEESFRDNYDLDMFGDPLAKQTNWSPLSQGGSSVCPQKLSQIDSERVEYKVTIWGWLPQLFFSGFGVILFFLGILVTIVRWELIWDMIGMTLFGLAFAAGFGYWLYDSAKPVVFDRRQGLFWKCYSTPTEFSSDSDNCARLEDIAALQILKKHFRASNHGRFQESYELNLVLKNGHRINVNDHGLLNKIREDAEQLSFFLDVPVWDVTNPRNYS